MMKAKLVYIDVCALSRPFDEQEYIRIRLETEAVNLILSKVREGILKMIVSPVHIKEIDDIPDMIERIELHTILNRLGDPLKGNKMKIRTRAEELIVSGFDIADAAHVACAEMAGASFISCDDRLIRKCLNNELAVWCGNPVNFCEEEGLR